MSNPDVLSPLRTLTKTDDDKPSTLSGHAMRFVVERPLAMVGLGLLFGFALGRALSR